MNRRSLSKILSLCLLFSALSGSAHLAAQTATLGYLSKHVGENPTVFLKSQPLARRVIALIGAAEYKSLITNMDVANGLTLDNGVYYSAGNAPHQGREEEGAIMIDPAKDSIQVFLLHKGATVHGWAENNRTVAIPKEVQGVLNNWPRQPLLQTLASMRQSASSTGQQSSTTPAAAAAGARSTGAAPASSTAHLCQSGAKCDEVATFAANVTDFRTSVSGYYKLVTVTVRLTNKLNRPLILGLVQQSAVAIDDQGNRYTLNGESAVRGIGLIGSNNSFDPKFTLQPGESADARIDLAMHANNRVIYGTSWDLSLALREIDPAGVNQYRMGRENAIRFDGLANRMAGSTVSASSAYPGSGAPVPNSLAAAPGVAASNALAPDAAATGNVPVGVADACNGAPKCYSTGVFSATIKSFMASSNGTFNDHTLRYEITFRNATSQPLILAYAARSSNALDNLGNQYYWGRAGTYDTSVQGIGVSQSDKVNTQFVLQPGESRNAVFQVVRYRPGKAQIGTSFTYGNSIELLEVLPSGQIRTLRSYSLSYPDLTPSNGLGIPGLNNGTNQQNINNSIKSLGSIFGKKR